MYSIIDIETTGAHAIHNRITEIAILNFDGEKITDQFISFVRPDSHIPFFISYLTGITNDMVNEAPAFEEIAEAIDSFTQNRVLVAHNAHFDYSFLKQAFQRTGKNFQRKTLCTLRLSRKILPGHRKYSLDHLCRSLVIESLPCHRAESDARSALHLFTHLIRCDREGIIASFLKKKQPEIHYPPHLALTQATALPESAGVYFFLDKSGRVLYIGKAKNLRSRIRGHFSGTSSTKAKTLLMNQIHHIQYEVCGTELIAMLRESALIKKHFPPFNTAQKISENNYGAYAYEDGKGYVRFGIKKLKATDRPLASFALLQEARHFLEEKRKQFHLCPKFCGLQQAAGACFDVALNLCGGACSGKESAEVYNQRAVQAKDSLKTESKTFIIVEKGRMETERSVVLVEDGKYLGYGFTSNTTAQEFQVLKENIEHQKDNREVQMILQSYLFKNTGCQIIFPA
ncbi:MAG: GIY-YIG nuclease family protein [Chitinophagales bacterium]|nr:GIY-YIG nuclease family protein [Chitinophagales bacterium]